MAKKWAQIDYLTDELTKLKAALGSFYDDTSLSSVYSNITLITSSNDLWFAYESTDEVAVLAALLSFGLVPAATATSFPSVLKLEDGDMQIFQPDVYVSGSIVYPVGTTTLSLDYILADGTDYIVL